MNLLYGLNLSDSYCLLVAILVTSIILIGLYSTYSYNPFILAVGFIILMPDLDPSTVIDPNCISTLMTDSSDSILFSNSDPFPWPPTHFTGLHSAWSPEVFNILQRNPGGTPSFVSVATSAPALKWYHRCFCFSRKWRR